MLENDNDDCCLRRAINDGFRRAVQQDDRVACVVLFHATRAARLSAHFPFERSLHRVFRTTSSSL